MEKARAVRLTIRGRVQGVGFRGFTIDAAGRAGIRGWVRNTPDGAVEIWAEGPPEALARFEETVRDGPPFARVASLDRAEGEPTGTFETFGVRY